MTYRTPLFTLVGHVFGRAKPSPRGAPRPTPQPPDLTDRLLQVYERGKRLSGQERSSFEASIISVCAALERRERSAAAQELNRIEAYLDRREAGGLTRVSRH